MRPVQSVEAIPRLCDVLPCPLGQLPLGIIEPRSRPPESFVPFSQRLMKSVANDYFHVGQAFEEGTGETAIPLVQSNGFLGGGGNCFEGGQPFSGEAGAEDLRVDGCVVAHAG